MRTNLLCTIGCLIFVQNSLASTIKVPAEQPTIQAGIDAAAEGDTVLVADGTYEGDGNRNLDFGGKAIVVMSQHGPEVTVIDCGSEGRGFFFHTNEDSTAVVEGFTIAGGFVQGSWSGAGIACDSSSPTIKNNWIVGNYSSGFLGPGCNVGGLGGGIFCRNSRPILSENLVVDNEATGAGGGVYCINSSPRFIRCTISDNVASGCEMELGVGDGIYIGEGSCPEVTMSIVHGLYIDSTSEPVFTCCYFDNPRFCDSKGGDYGISDHSPCAPANSECGQLIGAVDVGCSLYPGPVFHVSNDGSDETGDGSSSLPFASIAAGIVAAAEGDTVLVAPGVYSGEGNTSINFGGKNLSLIGDGGPDMVVIDCRGKGRAFTFSGGEDSTSCVEGFTITGGATYCRGIFNFKPDPRGGGILCVSSSPTICGNVITDNHAYQGGGVALYDSEARILNNTISLNGSTCTFGGVGGGIYAENCIPQIVGNIIIDNAAYEGDSTTGHGAGIYLKNCSGMLSRNTLFGNESISDTGSELAGGLVLDESAPSVERCLFAYNGALASWSSPGFQLPVISCCLSYGHSVSDTLPGVDFGSNIHGNVLADPQFCDAEAGDFRVSSCSPCAPSNNDCGELIGALGVGCAQCQHVYVDIKPGSCPNPLNGISRDKGKAVLPAAILGTTDFDVQDIDQETVTLNGIGPLRWSYQDISTPVDKTEDSCACSEDGPDGYGDLTLKFDRQAIISSLNPASTSQSETTTASTKRTSSTNDVGGNSNHSGPPLRASYVLRVEGQLKDGSSFEGYDCVVLMTKGDPVATAIEETPRELALIGNHPNPFNPVTRISLYLPQAVHVTIDIYNVLGQRVDRLVDRVMEPGEQFVEWDGTSYASGAYFYRFQAGEHVETKKMLLLK